MSNQLYIISLRWIDTPTNPEMMDNLLSRYGDWVRWNGWTWLLASRYTPFDIRQGLMSKLQSTDSFIIAPTYTVGMDGWAPEWVWTWARERSDPNYQPRSLPPPPPPPPTGGLPPPSPSNPFQSEKTVVEGLRGLFDSRER